MSRCTEVNEKKVCTNNNNDNNNNNEKPEPARDAGTEIFSHVLNNDSSIIMISSAQLSFAVQ